MPDQEPIQTQTQVTQTTSTSAPGVATVSDKTVVGLVVSAVVIAISAAVTAALAGKPEIAVMALLSLAQSITTGVFALMTPRTGGR